MKQKAYIKNGSLGNAMRDPHSALLKSRYIILIYASLITLLKGKGVFWGVTSCSIHNHFQMLKKKMENRF